MFGITDRRHFMKHVATGAAVTVPGLNFLVNVRAKAAEMKKSGKSLIILWMGGGPSTIDLWDMKPGSPNGGDHRPKPTAVSGIQISEHLPRIAEQFKHLSIIRSLSSGEGDHARGTYRMNTGNKPSPILEYPALGSVLSYYQAMDLEAAKNADIPAFIALGNTVGTNPLTQNAVGGGFLGMKYSPFLVQNPGQPPENVSPPLDPRERDARMIRRAALFDKLESGMIQTDANKKPLMDAALAHKDVYEKAMSLVVSSRKEVFNLDNELDGKPISPQLKEEYGAAGPNANAFGRSCLLARKLVEAGVACVQITLGGWDNHNGIFPILANQRLPVLDRGMGTLVKDLAQRGKLKDTVILWMGDFGRTPRINQNAGRDHYPAAWSVVLGGGNIRGGMVYGATDKDGVSVTENRVGVHDLFGTVYKGLGIDPTPETNASVRDNLGRPYYIAGNRAEIGTQNTDAQLKTYWIKELIS